MQWVGFSELVEATSEEIKKHIQLFFGWAGGIAAIVVGVEMLGPGEASASGIVFVLLTLFGQAIVTQKVMASRGIEVQATGLRIGSVFLIGLITGLGIALGLIFLILPGIYLMARWSLSVPALLATNGGVMDSIRKSWGMTQMHVLSLSIMFFVIYVPTNAAGMWINLAGTDDLGITALVPSIIANLLIELGAVTAWFASVAAYIVLGGAGNRIADIFD